MKKVLVTGAAGMLGTAIIDFLHENYSIIATDTVTGYSPDSVRWFNMDLLDLSQLKKSLIVEKPDFVVHCAALVNVDFCEKNPELAHSIHAITTSVITEEIQQWNGKLIYISTDSVFDGKKEEPYIETDSVNPLNVYAKTKFYGENETLKNTNNAVLRTNIFGWSRAEKISFAEWIIKGLVLHEKLTMFSDMRYTPIHVSHLAQIISIVIENEICGLYHATGSVSLSKYDFARSIAEVFELSPDNLIPVSISSNALEAKRPSNMACDNSKLAGKISMEIPGFMDGINLLKSQYNNGWLSKIKNRRIAELYKFWEIINEDTN